MLRAAAVQGDDVRRSPLLREAPLTKVGLPVPIDPSYGRPQARHECRSIFQPRGPEAGTFATSAEGGENAPMAPVPDFLQLEMRQGPCWTAQQGPGRRGPTLFFAAPDAPGSLLDVAKRTRATSSDPIFGGSKCARVFAGRRNKDPRDAVPPHFLWVQMRQAPCWMAQQGARAMWPNPIFNGIECATHLAVLENFEKLENLITF